jgi:hypothetical protein
VNNHHSVVTAICCGLILATNLLPTVVRAARKPKPNSFSTSGKVLKFTNGDLMYYVEIYAHGNNYNLGANFEICQQTKFLNQQVQLTFKRTKVNDCPSNEPCGKTRLENLIVKMKLAPTQ